MDIQTRSDRDISCILNRVMPLVSDIIAGAVSRDHTRMWLCACTGASLAVGVYIPAGWWLVILRLMLARTSRLVRFCYDQTSLRTTAVSCPGSHLSALTPPDISAYEREYLHAVTCSIQTCISRDARETPQGPAGLLSGVFQCDIFTIIFNKIITAYNFTLGGR